MERNDTEKTGPMLPIVSSSSSPPNPRSFKNIKLKITFLSHGLYQWGKKKKVSYIDKQRLKLINHPDSAKCIKIPLTL